MISREAETLIIMGAFVIRLVIKRISQLGEPFEGQNVDFAVHESHWLQRWAGICRTISTHRVSYDGRGLVASTP